MLLARGELRPGGGRWGWNIWGGGGGRKPRNCCSQMIFSVAAPGCNKRSVRCRDPAPSSSGPKRAQPTGHRRRNSPAASATQASSGSWRQLPSGRRAGSCACRASTTGIPFPSTTALGRWGSSPGTARAMLAHLHSVHARCHSCTLLRYPWRLPLSLTTRARGPCCSARTAAAVRNHSPRRAALSQCLPSALCSGDTVMGWLTVWLARCCVHRRSPRCRPSADFESV